jgi:hypothetical protein
VEARLSRFAAGWRAFAFMQGRARELGLLNCASTAAMYGCDVGC